MMSNCGTIQWVEDVRKKVNQTLKNRKPERNLVLRHLAKSHVSEPESHWHTLKLFLEDDEDFKNLLEDLIKEFQKNEEENKINIAMKNKLLESGSKKVANEPVKGKVPISYGEIIKQGIQLGFKAYRGDMKDMASICKAVAPLAGALTEAGIKYYLTDYVGPEDIDIVAEVGNTVITEVGNSIPQTDLTKRSLCMQAHYSHKDVPAKFNQMILCTKQGLFFPPHEIHFNIGADILLL